MTNFEHELRLLWLIATNAIVLLAAWRAAGALAADLASRVCNTLLIWWLVQYVAVGVTGISAVLTPLTSSAVGIVLSGGLVVILKREQTGAAGVRDSGDQPSLPFAVGAGFVCAFVGTTIFDARILPAMADDPLTYHLPAAAQWLLDRRISLFETWYFNPANTYSPLAGSMFAAWLMGPAHGDVVARFVQAPAILAIFSAVFAIARGLGGGAWTAMFVGVAAALCRPIVSQAILAKDDLFLCAFVLMAVNAAGQNGRLAAIRLGAAIGLAAATKYTSIYSLVILLLCVRPRAWKRWLPAGGIAILIVGPWLVRNATVTGNPLFPITLRVGDWTILQGLFSSIRSERLATGAGVWQSLVSGYFGIGVPMVIALGIAYVVAAVAAIKSTMSDPLRRAVLIGPPASVLAFVLTSPYAELRFVYAAIALLTCTVALIRPQRVQIGVAAALACVSISTSFAADWSLRMTLAAAIVTAAGWGVIAMSRRHKRLRLAASVSCGVVFLGLLWVNWTAYVTSLAPAADVAWTEQRGDLARAWTFVRTEIPTGEPIAYANTYLVYPLQGANLDRRTISLGPAVTGQRLHELRPVPQALNESTLLDEVMSRTAAIDLQIPPVQWARRLRAGGIRYLLVGKRLSPWTDREPVATDRAYESAARQATGGGMRIVFENNAAVVLECVANPAGR